MKKRICLMLLLAALCAALQLPAQTLPESFGVSKVESDALVAFIRAEFTPEIYFVKVPADKRNYTVRAPREQFLEKAFAALREGGYQVWQYDGKYFVAREGDLRPVLPTGYFARQEPVKPADDSSALYQGRSVTMTFQNKIYEIGDPERARRSGRASVRGYVRDADGEALIGVPVCIGESRVCTVTDSDGFYTFSIPVEDTTSSALVYSPAISKNLVIVLLPDPLGPAKHKSIGFLKALSNIYLLSIRINQYRCLFVLVIYGQRLFTNFSFSLCVADSLPSSFIHICIIGRKNS
jgi:hypothetical protein